MKRWQFVIVLLVIVSAVILAGNFAFDWQSSNWLKFSPVQLHPSDRLWERLRPGSGSFSAAATIGGLLSLALAGIMLMVSFPRQIKRMHLAFLKQPVQWLRLAALGVLALLLAAILGITASIRMLTLPLTFFVAAILFLAVVFGMTTLAFTLGRWLLQRAGWEYLSPVWAFLLGLLILFGISEIPYLGLFARLVIAALSLGVVLTSQFGSGRAWDLSVLNE